MTEYYFQQGETGLAKRRKQNTVASFVFKARVQNVAVLQKAVRRLCQENDKKNLKNEKTY